MPIHRILIVGSGSIGKRHIKIARKLCPNSDIRVLRHNFSNELVEGVDGIFYRLSDAINFQPEIAVLANPSSFHVQIALALTRAGVHLLIEKPISNSLVGIEELACLHEDVGTVIAVGYNLRFLDSLNFFRNELEKNSIGKILSVRIEVGHSLKKWRLGIDYKKSVSAQKELGGGVLLELSHEIDYLTWIFGHADWISAIHSQQNSLDINVEELAHLVLEVNSGLQESKFLASVSMDFIRHDLVRSCIAIGELGTLKWNGVSSEVSIYMENSGQWQVLFKKDNEYDESYVKEWLNFLGAVEGKELPLIGLCDGIKTLEVVLAAYASNQSDGAKVFL